MLTIGIVDDGIGAYPTLTKLKQAASANFICMIIDNRFPLGNCKGGELLSIGKSAVHKLAEMGCDAVVLSSVALSSRCFKPLSGVVGLDLFGCDAPVMHASTYTASSVLVVGDKFVTAAQNLPNVIARPMPEFPALAEVGQEREIVRYISENVESLYGQFDCIALANSSMNVYKHCFSRVFPNVQIFDSLEGVARKIRKKYKKAPSGDGFTTVVDANGAPFGEKYAFFLE